MRLTLLALAVFYAWLPSGLCACRLQAALFPPVRNASDTPPAPVDDDDDGPHECHCTGSKPVCDMPPAARLVQDATVALLAIVDVSAYVEVAVVDDGVLLPPVYHLLRPPLYLTVRALLI